MTGTPRPHATPRLPRHRAVLLLAGLGLTAPAASGRSQSFVEYPAHPATYGDHVITASWVGGPTTVSLQFFTDEAIVHADGNGQSQRTARNTLTHVPPAGPANPQDYDELRLVARYGTRLPLLQQMSADGTSTLRYQFAVPVSGGFNLFVTDVDDSDSLVVRAFGAGGVPLDMAAWALVAQGDLSQNKNTGTAYSPIVAPLPVTTVGAAGITFVAADDQNYNRSFAILAPPASQVVDHVDVTFTGHQNSASRADAGTGSHVYVALSTPLSGAAAPPEGPSPEELAVSPNPARVGRPLLADFALPASGRARLLVFDVAGRRVAVAWEGQADGTAHRVAWDGRDDVGRPLATGIYVMALHVDGLPLLTRRVVLAR